MNDRNRKDIARMLSFLTQSAPAAPNAGAAAASAMFDDDLFAQRTRAAFPTFSHHAAAPPHFPFGGFPVHHDPFGSKFYYVQFRTFSLRRSLTLKV